MRTLCASPARLLLGTLLIGLLPGCPPPPPAPPPLLTPRLERVTAWAEPIRIHLVPGHFALPWLQRPGAHLELWRIDLLHLDVPCVAAWLEAWRPGESPSTRRVPLPPSALADRIRLVRPGAYVVRSTACGEARVALVIASPLQAALTLASNDLETFCVDAGTGRPVQGGYVHVVYRTERLGRERMLIASGTTGSDGRWHTSLVRDRFAPSVVATAVVARGDDFALATATTAIDHTSAGHRITLRARHPVLRPGQTAELAGFLQHRVAEQLSPWANTTVRLSLLDPSGRLASTASPRTDSVGAFAATFKLGDDAAEGTYTVVAALEDSTAAPRRLQPFAVHVPKPEPFRLTVSLNRHVLIPGDTLTLAAKAQCADGSPVPNARVRILSWGYPIVLRGTPRWTGEPQPLDTRRVVALPIGLPTEARTAADGTVRLQWTPTRADAPRTDLLCGMRIEVDHPTLGVTDRSAECVLLAEPPPLAIEPPPSFQDASQPIELTFTTPLPPAEQSTTEATCSLAYESVPGGPQVFAIAKGPVSSFVAHRLVATPTKPGRYTFAVRAVGQVDQASIWVVDGEGDVPWHGAKAPTLFSERPWVAHDRPARAVVSAPRSVAPLALTIRSARAVTRRLMPLRTGSRSLQLALKPGDAGPIETTLVQFAEGTTHVVRETLDAEPGGRMLQITPRLLWVRHGEWSGRGYGIATHDRLGRGVQTIIHMELVRPSFEGSPPAAIARRTLHWHAGKATSQEGAIEVGFHDSLLTNATSLLVEAVAHDGRAGATLMPIRSVPHAAGLDAGTPRSPSDRLTALAEHGADIAVARWLTGCLVAQHPGLAGELPRLIAAADTGAQATTLLAIALEQPEPAPAVLEAALRRAPPARAESLRLAAHRATEFRTTLERILASDPDTRCRLAAARALGRALPASAQALRRALTTDGEPLVRAAAAQALARCGPAAANALGEAATAEADDTVRIALADALRRLGSQQAVEPLLALATAENEGLAVAALEALADIGYGGLDPRLFAILGSGPLAARPHAARLLVASQSPQATRAVLAAARKSQSAALIDTLAPLRTQEVHSAMARWLAHVDPAVRVIAAQCLAEHKDERARPVLRELLDPAVPQAVADRAGAAAIAWRDSLAAPKLAALLLAGRLSPATQRAFVREAGTLGWQEAGPALVSILWRAVAEPRRLADPEERQLWADAASAAAQVGPIWQPELAKALTPLPKHSPYAGAAAALEKDGLAAFLAALWSSPLPAEIRRHAVVPYARLRRGAAVPQLIDLFEMPDLQGAAIEALAVLDAVDPLIAALAHRSARIRSAAAAALGAAREPRATPALGPLLNDADPFVRLEAAHALAAITRQAVLYTDHLAEPRQALPPAAIPTR